MQSVALISHFLLAMIQYPDILKRAQKEIDSVVGTDRVTSFEDRAALPYCVYSFPCSRLVFEWLIYLVSFVTVECVFKETLRWAVPTPIGE